MENTSIQTVVTLEVPIYSSKALAIFFLEKYVKYLSVPPSLNHTPSK